MLLDILINMQENMKNKKILILGSTPQHIKLIEAAKRMGIYTIITDNLKNSIAKEIADEALMLDIKDTKGIVKYCKDNQVDGIISGYIDPCQRPYQEICELLGLPCYGNSQQFFNMTNKRAFKKMCIENNLDIIPEYTLLDVEKDNVVYPVFVKPIDSRGSRGQSICYNKNELQKAIEFAISESSNGDIIIEKYMKQAHEFQVTYFVVNEEPYLIRTCDSYSGSAENHLEKVVACSISPSKYTKLYLEDTHNRVKKMIRNLGIKDGPFFMQGFVDEGVFRFFDPGLRFPGVDYERIYQKVYGIDIMEAMVQIALTGKCSINIPQDGVWLKGKRAAILFPTVKAGVISRIEGRKNIESSQNVISYLSRCEEGDEISWTYNVNQRLAEIDILCDSTEELKECIKYVQRTLKVYDQNNKDMIFERFVESRVE